MSETQNLDNEENGAGGGRLKPLVSAFYVVTAYRYACRENHSYVVGLFDDESVAINAAKAEEEYRGKGKYFCEVLEMNVHKSRADIKAYKKLIYGEVDKLPSANRCYACGHDIEPGQDGR
jgi:hypothetical protein